MSTSEFILYLTLFLISLAIVARYLRNKEIDANFDVSRHLHVSMKTPAEGANKDDFDSDKVLAAEIDRLRRKYGVRPHTRVSDPSKGRPLLGVEKRGSLGGGALLDIAFSYPTNLDLVTLDLKEFKIATSVVLVRSAYGLSRSQLRVNEQGGISFLIQSPTLPIVTILATHKYLCVLRVSGLDAASFSGTHGGVQSYFARIVYARPLPAAEERSLHTLECVFHSMNISDLLPLYLDSSCYRHSHSRKAVADAIHDLRQQPNDPTSRGA